MTKLEYFVNSINNKYYLKRAWLLATYGILAPDTKVDEAKIEITSKGKFIDDLTGLEVTGFKIGEPLFGRDELIKVKAGMLKSIKSDIETTFGILIIDALLLEYPYDGELDFINGEITESIIGKVVVKRLLSEQGTVEEQLKFENAVSMTTALALTGVPSCSWKSITVNPESDKLKKKLLDQYAGQLHDPVVVADIQKQLGDLNKEYLKGDPAERFLIGQKEKDAYLKIYGIYGAEQDFDDESKISVMTNSLYEGWQVKDLPMMNNVVRHGSYSRGASTALGGAEVKFTARVFQNYTMCENPCTTKIGLEVPLNEDVYLGYVGRYILGDDKPQTVETLKQKIGKKAAFRSPAYCISPGTVVCRHCIGENVYTSGVGINAQAITANSTLMSVFMAMMHSQGLTVAEYNYLDRLS